MRQLTELLPACRSGWTATRWRPASASDRRIRAAIETQCDFRAGVRRRARASPPTGSGRNWRWRCSARSRCSAPSSSCAAARGAGALADLDLDPQETLYLDATDLSDAGIASARTLAEMSSSKHRSMLVETLQRRPPPPARRLGRRADRVPAGGLPLAGLDAAQPRGAVGNRRPSTTCATRWPSTTAWPTASSRAWRCTRPHHRGPGTTAAACAKTCAIWWRGGGGRLPRRLFHLNEVLGALQRLADGGTRRRPKRSRAARYREGCSRRR